MREHLKVFTFVRGHGETVIEPRHEDHINQWLASIEGTLVRVIQSESEHHGVGHHVTVCVWYVPSGEGRRIDAAARGCGTGGTETGSGGSSKVAPKYLRPCCSAGP